MRRAVISVLVLFALMGHAQNLVPNANFAAYSDCPTRFNGFVALGWTSPFFPGTPNYFNVCGAPDFSLPENFGGFQEPITGDGYIGIYTFGTREYIQAALIAPTVAGMTYELTIVYSSADNFGHADGLGMLLSIGQPATANEQLPQLEKTVVTDSQEEWHTLTYEYLSETGGETHITIGNFKNDANSNFTPEGMYRENAYYYIDSVAVKCLGVPSQRVVADLGGDLEVCATDFPLTIFSNLPGAYNEWSTGNIGNWIAVEGPGSYAIKSTINCEYGTDTIEIRLIEAPEEVIEQERICSETEFTISLSPELGDYEWSNGSLGPEVAIAEDGLYTVVLNYGCGTVRDSVTVVVGNNLIDESWPTRYVLCNEEPLSIDLSSTSANIVRWDDGATSTTRIFEAAGTYLVRLGNACSDTTFRINFEQELCSSETIYVPNAFSPNDDGINDYLSIGFSNNWVSPKIKFYVFNRWGATVFFSEDPRFRWSGDFKGQILDPGLFTYFYELEVEINGQIRTMTESGGVTLLR